MKRSMDVLKLKDILNKKWLNSQEVVLIELKNHGTINVLEDNCPIGKLPSHEDMLFALEIGGKCTNGSIKISNIESSSDGLILIVSNIEVCNREHRR